ncbi:MAG TPA: alpha/beta hydrolase [Planctomycetaceae bacterium]|nr:alpha/beta hydrolase [Planctomycetaceae bacterium]HQZ64958.1 alpha/beta hydrolase [Planctomycetaceae bacterium]
MTETWIPATVNFAGHRVAALLRGNDRRLPPVILIHGITAAIDLWPAVLQEAAEQFRSCSLSLPGHAPSITPAQFRASDVTSDLFADIVIAAAKQIYPDEAVHLIGWSTGGFAALAAAAKQPKLFASVSSISGFAHGRWGDLLGLLQWLAASKWRQPICRWTLTRLGRKPWLLDRILNRFCSRKAMPRKYDSMNGNTMNLDAVQSAWNSLHTAAGRHDPRVMSALLQGIRQLDLTDQLCRITVPTQIISGDADPVIRNAEAIHLANTIKPSKLVVIPDCGHLFFAEARERILDLAVNWVHQHDHNSEQESGPGIT